MASNHLYRLIYCSQVSRAEGQGDVDLADILRASRKNNRAVEVTGALLCCDGRFLQALEGPMTGVIEIYTRILQDPRHENIQVLERTSTEARRFADWSMCGAQLSATDEQIVAMLTASGMFDPAKLTPSRALRLLEAIGRIHGAHSTSI